MAYIPDFDYPSPTTTTSIPPQIRNLVRNLVRNSDLLICRILARLFWVGIFSFAGECFRSLVRYFLNFGWPQNFQPDFLRSLWRIFLVGNNFLFPMRFFVDGLSKFYWAGDEFLYLLRPVFAVWLKFLHGVLKSIIYLQVSLSCM